MNLNICQCGSQDGYPHKEDCPYPYFRDDEKGVYEWEKAHTRRLFLLTYGIDFEVVKFARENKFWDLLDENGNPVELPAVLNEGKESQLTMRAADDGYAQHENGSQK